MNILDKKIHNGRIVETQLTRKLVIAGITEIHKVYRVPLDLLYYNDRNDRIATWISKYKKINNLHDIDMSDRESYNDLIENFIRESDPKLLNETKNNIEFIGQQQPGITLFDGRVIDGNRRFSYNGPKNLDH